MTRGSSAAAEANAHASTTQNSDERAADPARISGRACRRRACRSYPARKQFVPLLARLGDAARLAVAVAANLLGQRGELDGERKVLTGQAGEQFFDDLLVFVDERALAAPLLGATERIERRAAQPLELGQPAHGDQHPGSERNLARLPPGGGAFAPETPTARVT